uniref:LEM domain-containing protein n=1 Tax=Xiphophorus couchianus TaxID=32473 RepID=A0A3B5L6T8_9TELE
MASLDNKSPQEISDLLDEYGIKHGPVVGTTRNLYVKKLKEAMAKGKKAKPSSDKTYYREEGKHRILTCCFRPYMYDTPSTYSSNSYAKPTPMKSEPEKPKAQKSSRLIPLWLQFVFFLALAAFLYLVFSNMETNEPIQGIV